MGHISEFCTYLEKHRSNKASTVNNRLAAIRSFLKFAGEQNLRIVDRGAGLYINISRNQIVNEKIKAVTGLANLDVLYLTKAEIDSLFENCMLIDC